MAVITFPDTLYASRMRLELRQQGAVNEGPFGMQFSKTGSPKWAAMVELALNNESESGAYKSLLLQLRGPTNQLALHDLARPAPLGTMRGALTFAAAAAIGDTTISVTGGASQAGKTLMQGDLIGFGSGLTQQVVMVVADATADGSGVISVTVEPPLRSVFSSGDAATWDKPKVLYRNQEVAAGWDYESVFASGFRLNLIEDVRP